MAKDQFSAAVCGKLQPLQAMGLLTVDERTALQVGNWQRVLRGLYRRANELQRGPCGDQYRRCIVEVLTYLVQQEFIKPEQNAIRNKLLAAMHDRGLALVGAVSRGEIRRSVLMKAAGERLERHPSYWIIVFRTPADYFDLDTFDTKPFLKLFSA